MRWLNVGLSAFIAWQVTITLGLPLGGMVAVFLVCFVVIGLFTSGLTGGIWNSGLWTTLPIRRLVGLTADGTVLVVLFEVVVSFGRYLDVWGHVFRAIGPDEFQSRLVAWSFWLLWCLGLPYALSQPVKTIIGKMVGPVARVVRSRFIGMGGSSTFGGLFADWAHPWKPGQLLLGGSIYSPGWKVGRSDDRHFITIATSRSGKGRSAIIPNLLTWPGSALVIDPKGQNAAVTAAARGKGGGRVTEYLGQTIRIVDPFGELKGQGLDLPVHRFNPLAEIDPGALDAVEQIRRLTDALVMPDPSGAKDFWDRSASNVISGIIAAVLTSPPEQRTLHGVRDLLKRIGEPALREAIAKRPSVGGLAQAALSTLDNAGENAEGDIIATALSHTDWLDSLAMARVLDASDFSLSELKTGLCTIYLVLPPQYLDVHGRFLRLFVNLGRKAHPRKSAR